jgi:NAD(P)-dependent dehydrogenase (short-subunit alcohol dehydrogenase family)
VAHRIQAKGGEVTYVAADVADGNQLQAVAVAAIARFGGFDTRINNAGISIWGRLEEVSEQDSRRLFDTNFWGVVHGSLISAAHLKDKGGAIINLGSVASDIGLPLQGMYLEMQFRSLCWRRRRYLRTAAIRLGMGSAYRMLSGAPCPRPPPSS